jgi:hypothetical protein
MRNVWFVCVTLLCGCQSQPPTNDKDITTTSEIKPPKEACFPACRGGYICHPTKRICVEGCNPPCDKHKECEERTGVLGGPNGTYWCVDK